MADSPTSFARYAGVAHFPRSDADLRSTAQCPACFTPVTTIVCTECHLDLGHEAAAELALMSTEAARVLDERVELIGRIRFETALAKRQAEAMEQATAAALAAAPADAVPVRTPAAQPAQAEHPAQAEPAATTTAPGVRPAATTGAPRRSSVQVGLLIVGVSLVSIAAIYFLVYAFINYGIVWRSLIIGAITVAAFVTASLLRRRGLASTAEGIGAFAVVLVYLDAFAIRANDLFGAGSSNALVYWGATLVLSALGFAIWQRASMLRVGSVAAAIAFAPGVGLLLGGASEQLAITERLFVAFVAVALAGLVHPFVGARGAARQRVTLAERAIAVSIGGLGLAVALFVGFGIAQAAESTGYSALDAAALWAVAVVALAHVVVVVRTTDGTLIARVIAVYFAAVGGVSVVLAIVLLAFRTFTSSGAIVGVTVAPTLVVLVLAFLALRPGTAIVRLALRGGALAAGAVTICMLLIPTAQLVVLASSAIRTAAAPGTRALEFTARLATPGADVIASAFALVAVIAAVVAFARFARTVDRLRAPLAWACAVLAVLAVPLLGQLGATMIGWLVLASAAVAGLVWSRRAGTIAHLRLPLTVLAVAATVLAYAVSWSGSTTWLAASIATVALLIVARWAVPAAVAVAVVRATLLGGAVVVALVTASAAGRQYGTFGDIVTDGSALSATAMLGYGAFGAFDGATVNSARAVAALGIVLFGLSATPLRRALSSIDLRVVFVLAAGAVLVSAAFCGGTLLLSLALLAAVLAWIVPRATPNTLLERRFATVILAPTLFWVLASLAARMNLDGDAHALSAIVAALLAAAVSLAIAVTRPAPRADHDVRRYSDVGIAVVAVPALAGYLLAGSPYASLALLLAAVTVLLCAIAPTGLFAAHGRRKHLGWLSLALATLALWWRLGESSVSAIEAYVLPLAGVLLAIAALTWRARRSTATPGLVFAALFVSIVPIAVSTTSGEPAKAVLVGTIAAALLLVGSVARTAAWARPYLDAFMATGAAAVVIVTLAQCLRSSATDVTSDVWLAAALVVLVIAAYGQCSERAGDHPLTPRVGQALALAGLTLVVGVETTLLDTTTLGFARTVVVVTLFSALSVAGLLVGRLPFDRISGWVSLGYATITAVAALAAASVSDVEWVSVPIALALLICGGVRLAREPQLRSATALGGGLLVLFLPSLLESSGGSPVWRLVVIGVLAVAAVVIGVMRRLQAPFVVGGVVAIVHGLTTFAPQISAVYESTEWWVWAGIGGAVIIVLAARYERSLATAKNVVASIGGLR